MGNGTADLHLRHKEDCAHSFAAPRNLVDGSPPHRPAGKEASDSWDGLAFMAGKSPWNSWSRRGSPLMADFHEFVGSSPPMQQLYRTIRRIASEPVPVVLVGETGTGKNLCARTISEIDDQRAGCVRVNCAALPDALIDSALFGHEKGAFTGAVRRRTGYLAKAHLAILFLDEVADLPLETQARLLHALESGEFRPVGGDRTLTSDFRIIVATQNDPDRLADEGRMRRDFLHRLGRVRIRIPPLRSRKSDIPTLARQFLRRYCTRASRKQPIGLGDEALQVLVEHSWPGNVRELQHVIEAAAALEEETEISAGRIRSVLQSTGVRKERRNPPSTLEEAVDRAEREAVRRALREAGGVRREAAKLLDTSEATLYRKLAQIEEVERSFSEEEGLLESDGRTEELA